MIQARFHFRHADTPIVAQCYAETALIGTLLLTLLASIVRVRSAPLRNWDARSTGVMSSPASQRTKVKRAAERGSYEMEHIHNILDEGLVAHVGLVQDGSPIVIPMGYARKGNQLLLHGSISSRLMKVSRPKSLAVMHRRTVHVLSLAAASTLFALQLTVGTAIGNEVRFGSLRDRHFTGWLGAGKIPVPPLNELPLSSGHWTPSGAHL